MGLFGYNKKTFAKNAAAITADVQEKMAKVFEIGDSMNVGALLNTVITLLGKESFPEKASGKAMEAIDKTIFGLLDKMTTDLQEKNLAKAYEHCLILIDEIENSRAYGKEIYSPDDLNLREQMATLKGQISHALDEKSVLAAKKSALLAKAQGKDKAAQQKIKLEYDLLTQQEQRCDAIINMNMSRYNAAVQVLKTRQIGVAAKAIEATQIISPEAFARESAEYSKIIEKEHAKDTEIVDTGNEFSNGLNTTFSDTQSDSEFYDRLNAEGSGAVSSAIDGSSAQTEDDEFWKSLSGKE